MPGHFTPADTLDRLKKEAKRWLKALRANTGDARERFAQALPNPPADPTLRDVQHAVARELGFPGWTALKRALESELPPPGSREALVNRFLDNACPDHHVRGISDHIRAQHTAMRLLERHPEIARDNFYTTLVCGDFDGVTRALAANPKLASTKSPGLSPYRAMVGGSHDLFQDLGPKGWEPVLYLCFTRLPLEAVHENAVAIARLLLENGADPNVYFMAGASHYTPLSGVIGEGEENRPAHSRRNELVQVLLDAGAEPYDGQVLYNMGFKGDYLWYLPMIYERSLQLGRKADWEDPEWRMLSMGPYGTGARWQLEHAIKQSNDIELLEWCLEHGANPNSPPASDQRFPQYTLYELAMRLGFSEMAELLVRYGAKRTNFTLDPMSEFVAACMRLDREDVGRQLREHPEYLKAPEPLFEAAQWNRPDVVEFLLSLGISPDVEDEKKVRPLHMAAYENAVDAARLLISRGAEIDPVEQNHGNTPLGAAAYYRHREMIDLLSPLSRDVGELTYLGKLDRLREVIGEDRRRAKVVWGPQTPLMWLPPHDESLALEIARLYVENAADPSLTDENGLTAADRAEAIGMLDVAAYLRSATASG
jgi:ankyrin repeat protein